ncbi:stress-activated map kinase interacting protein 1-domain-containing protein [Flagelloscypha sp. PMI_526]|nr:stress-activated map kinase interacting protein 1-domain-containing protein [Flagelloscypha sp. PMI_526]
MALLSDPDYLIHQIRLSYLREVEDIYGPRIISIPAHTNSNPYITTSGLSNPELWPELNMPSSPNLSEDEAERPMGFPGARLKYSTTIMGGRTGGLGMRTHAKRQSTSKRLSLRQHPDKESALSGTLNEENVLTKAATTDGALGKADELVPPPPTQKAVTDPTPADGLSPNGVVAADSRPDIAVQVQQPTIPEEAPVQRVVQFIPKFRNNDEMERRRRARMAARRGFGASAAPADDKKPAPPLSVDTTPESSASESSSDDESSLSADSDFGTTAVNDADAFDPDFATSLVHNNSASSAASLTTSASIGSVPRDRPRASSTSRLSPVSEKPPSNADGSAAALALSSEISTSESTSPYFPPRKLEQPPSRPRTSSQLAPTPPAPPLLSEPTISFNKQPLRPHKPQRSLLTSMIAAHSSAGPNPYAEMYAAISGRGSSQGGSHIVQVFFPSATDPRGEALELNVRNDAIIEEVLGFALWSYWDAGWAPKLDEKNFEHPEDTDEGKAEREVRFSAVGWILRIAEEDGEVDDDFPPPDRTAKSTKFTSVDAFAVLEATPAQVEQNRKIEAQIERRPSRSAGGIPKKPSLLLLSNTNAAAQKSASTLAVNTTANNPSTTDAQASSSHPSTSAPFGSYAGAPEHSGISSSLLGTGSSSRGPQIFLRIRISDAMDAAHFMTTIPVSSTMYMQEVLEAVCRKQRTLDPKDYALVLKEANLIVPLDRTVASLEGRRELMLVKRSMLPTLGVEGVRTPSKGGGDPNESIFKRMSDGAGVGGVGGAGGMLVVGGGSGASQAGVAGVDGSVLDPTTQYKKYTVTRKIPMLVTSRERTLAIDGVYVHIMPSLSHHSAKTESFHIKSIADCQQSGKSQAFKIVLNSASGGKRREYEAETPKLAAEIVATIQRIRSGLGRGGTVGKGVGTGKGRRKVEA